MPQFKNIVVAREHRDRMILKQARERSVEDFKRAHFEAQMKAHQEELNRLRHEEVQHAIRQRRIDDDTKHTEQMVQEILQDCTERVSFVIFIFQKLFISHKTLHFLQATKTQKT